ncbi:MAG: orotate phosphoribosyltransferase [Armatimonadetes bacterium]|nr:orotate phosphoribosyltransferase [Armatimonadota bacterium]
MIDLGKLLEESGAILKGHFELTSGRHSDVYFEKFRVIELPHVLTALCEEIANHMKSMGLQPKAIAGPTTGGIIIAFELARQLGLPAIYIETENGVKTLRRGKTLPKGHTVFIIDDVLTTGRSIIESQQAIENAGGTVIGAAALIDRAEKPLEVSYPLISAYKVAATSYAPDEVPEWLKAIPVTKPGTRATT